MPTPQTQEEPKETLPKELKELAQTYPSIYLEANQYSLSDLFYFIAFTDPTKEQDPYPYLTKQNYENYSQIDLQDIEKTLKKDYPEVDKEAALEEFLEIVECNGTFEKEIEMLLGLRSEWLYLFFPIENEESYYFEEEKASSRRTLYFLQELTGKSQKKCKALLTHITEEAGITCDLGITLKLEPSFLKNWMESMNIFQALQKHKDTEAYLSAFDFCNGSGHFTDIQIKKERIPRIPDSQIRLINNFLYHVFAICHCSTIQYNGNTAWNNNHAFQIYDRSR